MTPQAIDGAGLTPTERQAVQGACTLLQLEPSEARKKLSAGRSGSLVVRLHSRGQPMVLKITTDTARLARARSELRILSDGHEGRTNFMPRYIAGHDARDTVCLLTEEHQPLPHPRAISDEEWVALANSLGRLHDVPVMPRWRLRRAVSEVDAQAEVDAVRWWAELGRADEAEVASHLIRRCRSDCPDTVGLEHGDCHTENIVCDENGDLRWIDWQEARLAIGVSDLVFLWQRAEFAGAMPPRDAMTDAYCAARGLDNDSRLQTALDVAELRLLFINWPPFMTFGTEASRQRLMQRLPVLVDSLS
jgi:aminoglycoside phosphotransferase (APT) family kinase protein